MSKSEYQRFRSECLKWIKLLGLSDWQLTIEQRELHPTDYQTRARASFNWVQRVGTITWNSSCVWNRDCPPEETAFHEVLHIAIAPLMCVCEQDGSDAETSQSEEHGLIRRLVGAVYGTKA